MNFSQESCSELVTTTKSSLAEELAQVKDKLSKEKDALQEQLAIVTAQVSRSSVWLNSQK